MKHNLVCYLQEDGVAFLFPLLHPCYLRPILLFVSRSDDTPAIPICSIINQSINHPTVYLLIMSIKPLKASTCPSDDPSQSSNLLAFHFTSQRCHVDQLRPPHPKSRSLSPTQPGNDH